MRPLHRLQVVQIVIFAVWEIGGQIVTKTIFICRLRYYLESLKEWLPFVKRYLSELVLFK